MKNLRASLGANSIETVVQERELPESSGSPNFILSSIGNYDKGCISVNLNDSISLTKKNYSTNDRSIKSPVAIGYRDCINLNHDVENESSPLSSDTHIEHQIIEAEEHFEILGKYDESTKSIDKGCIGSSLVENISLIEKSHVMTNTSIIPFVRKGEHGFNLKHSVHNESASNISEIYEIRETIEILIDNDKSIQSIESKTFAPFFNVGSNHGYNNYDTKDHSDDDDDHFIADTVSKIDREEIADPESDQEGMDDSESDEEYINELENDLESDEEDVFDLENDLESDEEDVFDFENDQQSKLEFHTEVDLKESFSDNIKIKTNTSYDDKTKLPYHVDNDDVRGIVDLDYFADEIMIMVEEHLIYRKCSERLRCIKKQHLGLDTICTYHCRKCKLTNKIRTQRATDKKTELNCNEAAVLGTINIGIGQNQLLELFASMNIECMTGVTYKHIADKLLEILRTVSTNSMNKAGLLEKEHAVLNNQYHEVKSSTSEHSGKRFPWIAITCDGSWMTRSYGTNYASLSGLAVIVGMHTGKVLYVGVKNKYCAACSYAERNMVKPKEHNCFKNFDRDAASTAMESAILLEGFQDSIHTHKVLYKVMVADGDANAFKTLEDSAVYDAYDLMPVRIRCYNHLQRNLNKKLDTIVSQCIAYRNEHDDEHASKVCELRRDILNLPNHIFGDHNECKERGYNCSEIEKTIDDRESNYVPEMKQVGLFDKVFEAVNDLSVNSESLLYRVTNNYAEGFNSLVAVHIGGKRINWGTRGQYFMRALASAIRHNTGAFLSSIYEHIGDIPSVVHKVDTARQKKVNDARILTNTRGRKRQYGRVKPDSGKYYGPQSQKSDKDSLTLKVEGEAHKKVIEAEQADRVQIEIETREQANCPRWTILRKSRLTASHFGPIMGHKSGSALAARVKQIRYPSKKINQAMQYGIDHEADAINDLGKLLKKNIEKCGLFIDPVDAYLACSPDGVIGDDTIVEVKTSIHANASTAEEAVKSIKQRKGFLKLKSKGCYEMNSGHHYYAQVQGQLHTTQRKYCYFVFWTPLSFIHVKLVKDDEFWEKNMKPSLVAFYDNHLLPEILDSRHNRSMPIRGAENKRKKKSDEPCDVNAKKIKTIDDDNVSIVVDKQLIDASETSEKDFLKLGLSAINGNTTDSETVPGTVEIDSFDASNSNIESLRANYVIFNKNIPYPRGFPAISNNFNGLALQESDFKTLAPYKNRDQYLNDNIINGFLSKMNSVAQKNGISLVAFDTFLVNSMIRNSSGFLKWAMKNNVLSKNVCLFPIHSDEHWTLIVSVKSKKCLVYLDSLHHISSGIRQPPDTVLNGVCSLLHISKEQKWKLYIPKDIPIQGKEATNNQPAVAGGNCGVHLCAWAYKVASASLDTFNDWILENYTRKCIAKFLYEAKSEESLQEIIDDHNDLIVSVFTDVEKGINDQRTAKVDKLCMLTLNTSKIARLALEFTVDMLNNKNIIEIKSPKKAINVTFNEVRGPNAAIEWELITSSRESEVENICMRFMPRCNVEKQ
uniref:Ubiquitin-like protease family profile domain-containing protein n=1 Tax=Trichogramma kaykai TaxID=54128 RepID=A0ABD2XTU8_9HYME